MAGWGADGLVCGEVWDWERGKNQNTKYKIQRDTAVDRETNTKCRSKRINAGNMSEVQVTIPANIIDIPLNEWIYERVREFITGRVLEIATGSGNLAPFCEQNNLTTDVISIDLANESFDENYAQLLGAYDTVIALHISDQIASNRLLAINCKKLLKPGGHFITRLLARTALYDGLDQGFKRWTIYNHEFINRVLRKDYSIIKIRYFIIGGDHPLRSWVNKYSELVKLIKTDKAAGFNQVGLSIIVVGRKRPEATTNKIQEQNEETF